MILIDTSYLVALAMPNDALHSLALAWSKKLSGPFVTTDYILCELFNSLSLPAHRPRAHTMWSIIQKTPLIEVVHVTSDLLHEAIGLHAERIDKSWSLTDCVSFCLMQQRRLTEALTYDRHFDQAGFTALLRQSPR